MMADEAFSSKLMHGFSKLLDERLKIIATKDDIGLLENIIRRLSEENKALQTAVCDLKKENSELRGQINELDRRTRGSNVVLHGVKCSSRENLKGTATKLLKDLVFHENTDFDIMQVTKLGSGDAPLLVKLSNPTSIPIILRNGGKLKDSGISVSRDMSLRDRINCNRTLWLRRELRKRFGGKFEMKIQYNRLQINGKTFEWDGDDLTSNGEDFRMAIKRIVKEDIADDIIAQAKTIGVVATARKKKSDSAAPCNQVH